MKQLSPLVFLGTEDFSAQILEVLIDSDFKIEAIITKPDQPAGRGRKLKPTAVKLLAKQHQIPTFEVINKADIRQAIANTSQTTAVLAAFGKIIPEDVITAFTNGIINVHPSLLPKYRGPSPIISSILAGDKSTGVSIISLINEVDAGPIYNQVKVNLTGKETTTDLSKKLANIGGKLLIETLKDIENGLKAQPQDHSQATFCHMIKKTDGIIKPNEITAKQAERQIRAFLDWLKSRLKNFRGQDLIILSATDNNAASSPIAIKCKDNRFLNVQTLLSPNGKVTTAEQYCNNFLAK